MKSHAFLLLAITLSGCAANVVPQATGGSKADGTVVLSYEIGIFRRAVIDHNAALALAKKKCQNWGYLSAEQFGGVKRECTSVSNYGSTSDPSCNRHRFDITYQCLGQPDD